MIIKSLWNRMIRHMQPIVWFGSAGLIIAFVIFGGLFTDTAQMIFEQLQSHIINYFGWFYLLTATVLLAMILYLLFSPYAGLRLGPPDSTPEFSNFSWFAMLFSAGMGIGIVFWAVAEPLNHYIAPPQGDAKTAHVAQDAIRYAFFHWGVHPWAIYLLFAMALAYYHFRHGLPLAPRTMLYPLFGNRIYGGIGHAIDIIATVGTLFGVATSLGLGAMQINVGLTYLFNGIGQSTEVQLWIIGVITFFATFSVVSGLKRGIKLLSLTNMACATVLMLFVFICGPTPYIMETFVSGLGTYIQKLPKMSLWIDPGQQTGWHADWTLFYWSWWISWSPFVGVFVARISKGRTVREFIMGMMFAPVLGTFFWISVFGGTALYLQQSGKAHIAAAIKNEPALSLHLLLEHLPLSGITTILATLLIIIFFITSSDSGSLVDDMVTSGGDPDPPRPQRIFWAVSEGSVAAVLLTVGGLNALRTASLTSGLAMSVILLLTAWGLRKSFITDYGIEGIPERTKLKTK